MQRFVCPSSEGDSRVELPTRSGQTSLRGANQLSGEHRTLTVETACLIEAWSSVLSRAFTSHRYNGNVAREVRGIRELC